MLVAIIFAILLLAYFGTSYYFFHVAIARNKKNILKESPDFDPEDYIFDESSENWMKANKYEVVYIASKDGLRLHGYFFRAVPSADKTVILAHGYNSKGLHMHGFAKLYYEKWGYNVLVPDARAHGESEGKYIGFGWLDRKDYIKWINKAIELTGGKSSIVLHGISMGGATVLMTTGESLPEQVKAVVSDCAYTSAYDELSWQMDRIYHLPAFPLLNSTSLMSRIIAGYFFKEASALEQVKKTRLPILFIHGGSDSFVPHEMAKRLYDAAACGKELLIIPGAGHGLASVVDSEKYETCVYDFLKRYILPADLKAAPPQ